MSARIEVFRSFQRRALGLVLAASLPSGAWGQGRTDYFNVETPVGQAIAIARIANHDYLLVCNTPDGSVEVYDTDEALPASSRLLARIPVGMEPNSILWDGSRSRVFVTCFLNDSVESFILRAPTGPASFGFTLDQTKNLGDEPADLALTPDNQVLLVSFMSKSAIGAFDPVTLSPVPASTAFPAPTDNILLRKTIGTVDSVIKEPRPIALSGNQLFVLNHKGGTAIANPPFVANAYDFDLYARDLTSGEVVPMGNLGSTNWNMRFASNGDLYVVSGLAQIDLIGGPNVAGAPTGFVKSLLQRVTGAGTAGAAVLQRDINTEGSGTPVLPSEALAMPTDLVVVEPASGPTKVYVAAFGSDRVGVVTLANPADASTWTLARIAIPVAPLSSNPRSGPRALVFKSKIVSSQDPGDRVYVLNRLDNSVSILNPQTNAFVETFALRQDPTPAYIREGREFLYSADLSASGFVSCASCHADGRTDSLGWDLGSPNGFGAKYLRGFVDSPSGATLLDLTSFLMNGFTPNKGPMVTQTLQGLLDFEVAPDVQDLVTNAPYHWRGDRHTFTDFNEAFANLLALGDNFGTGGPGALPMGIDPADMETFEEFVNSIHYPPNPKQPETRVFSGDVGTDPDDQSDGSLALRGMKIFHITRQASSVGGGRSCAQCHPLPSGSNLRNTITAFDADDFIQPIESAQLRGLFQREPRFEADGYAVPPSPLAGMFGLAHVGGRGTINAFTGIFQNTMTPEERKDLNQFLHEFDWGSGPMIGRELRVTVADVAGADPRIAQFEAQVRAGNCGLAVGGVASGPIGYWYDPTQDLYVEEASAGANAVPRSALLALVTGIRHRLFFRCTPLGSERRIAALDGSATSLADPLGPDDIQLLPLAPNTAWAPVPTLTKNWIPLAQGGTFDWSHATDPNMPTPRFVRAIRQFQYGLIDPGNLTNYGLTGLRHDAPRRFRVSGERILPGAKLVLWTPDDSSGAPPDTGNPPDPAKARRVELPLYATSATNAGDPVWETAVELAPLEYYTLLNGGIEAPGVRDTLSDALSTLPEPPTSGTFDPDQFNWHYVEVLNPDGNSANGGWRQLTLQ